MTQDTQLGAVNENTWLVVVKEERHLTGLPFFGYKIYYIKHTTASMKCILNNVVIKHEKAEYGLTALHQLMDAVSKKNINAVLDTNNIFTSFG